MVNLNWFACNHLNMSRISSVTRIYSKITCDFRSAMPASFLAEMIIMLSVQYFYPKGIIFGSCIIKHCTTPMNTISLIHTQDLALKLRPPNHAAQSFWSLCNYIWNILVLNAFKLFRNFGASRKYFIYEWLLGIQV